MPSPILYAISPALFLLVPLFLLYLADQSIPTSRPAGVFLAYAVMAAISIIAVLTASLGLAAVTEPHLASFEAIFEVLFVFARTGSIDLVPYPLFFTLPPPCPYSLRTLVQRCAFFSIRSVLFQANQVPSVLSPILLATLSILPLILLSFLIFPSHKRAIHRAPPTQIPPIQVHHKPPRSRRVSMKSSLSSLFSLYVPSASDTSARKITDYTTTYTLAESSREKGNTQLYDTDVEPSTEFESTVTNEPPNNGPSRAKILALLFAGQFLFFFSALVGLVLTGAIITPGDALALRMTQTLLLVLSAFTVTLAYSTTFYALSNEQDRDLQDQCILPAAEESGNAPRRRHPLAAFRHFAKTAFTKLRLKPSDAATHPNPAYPTVGDSSSCSDFCTSPSTELNYPFIATEEKTSECYSLSMSQGGGVGAVTASSCELSMSPIRRTCNSDHGVVVAYPPPLSSSSSGELLTTTTIQFPSAATTAQCKPPSNNSFMLPKIVTEYAAAALDPIQTRDITSPESCTAETHFPLIRTQSLPYSVGLDFNGMAGDEDEDLVDEEGRNTLAYLASDVNFEGIGSEKSQNRQSSMLLRQASFWSTSSSSTETSSLRRPRPGGGLFKLNNPQLSLSSSSSITLKNSDGNGSMKSRMRQLPLAKCVPLSVLARKMSVEESEEERAMAAGAGAGAGGKDGQAFSRAKQRPHHEGLGNNANTTTTTTTNRSMSAVGLPVVYEDLTQASSRRNTVVLNANTPAAARPKRKPVPLDLNPLPGSNNTQRTPDTNSSGFKGILRLPKFSLPGIMRSRGSSSTSTSSFASKFKMFKSEERDGGSASSAPTPAVAPTGTSGGVGMMTFSNLSMMSLFPAPRTTTPVNAPSINDSERSRGTKKAGGYLKKQQWLNKSQRKRDDSGVIEPPQLTPASFMDMNDPFAPPDMGASVHCPSPVPTLPLSSSRNGGRASRDLDVDGGGGGGDEWGVQQRRGRTGTPTMLGNNRMSMWGRIPPSRPPFAQEGVTMRLSCASESERVRYSSNKIRKKERKNGNGRRSASVGGSVMLDGALRQQRGGHESTTSMSSSRTTLMRTSGIEEALLAQQLLMSLDLETKTTTTTKKAVMSMK
ncbi:hypothetical protein AMATHDRAFT_6665 [Amanita thiersii Skay4041]|uniref:Transmembrane protein n=1 Tax=Amanita thiersii Skay4041 TaxID=703135 RepID=A0A2A9NGY5_9AGAR|nr:hypothetical protein AMATHDRAFT_6665 [Amanita thiersii Skay4041]